MSTLKCLHDSKCFKYHLRASLPAVVAPPATQHHRTRGPLCRIKNMSRVRPATRQRKRASAKSSWCDKQNTPLTELAHTHTRTHRKKAEKVTHRQCVPHWHTVTHNKQHNKSPQSQQWKTRECFLVCLCGVGYFLCPASALSQYPEGILLGWKDSHVGKQQSKCWVTPL
jgi:hypothetical protein